GRGGARAGGGGPPPGRAPLAGGGAMRRTPTEVDRLPIFTAAELARRRRAKGWKLTHPEALAIICDDMHEAARGGASYEGVMAAARSAVAASTSSTACPS